MTGSEKNIGQIK